MQALILTMAVLVVTALVLAVPRWRLRRAVRQPLPPAWDAILRANIPVYPRMEPELRAQLQRLVQQFLHQKKFVGCAGQEIDDEVRLTIAAQACMLLLNRPSKVYPGLHTVLVYPSSFMAPRRHVDAAGVVTEARQDLLGESWGDGRVILSWDHVRRGAHDWTDGQNVVLHEFAHQLDSESGSNNGAPYLGSRDSYRAWSEVLSRNFERLRFDAAFQLSSVLDHYGAQDPAEFFAVATETFFEKPWQLAERHPDLFAELHKYYRVDPRNWLTPPEPEPEVGFSYGQWQ
ncbi:MAG: zinc-dependent peptidase [Gammaproteobacteria bacterium]